MKKQFLSYSFFLLPFFVFAQSLNIVYDAQSGNLSYFRNGEEIDSPMAKKGEKITVKVKNYNNYLYELKVKEEQQEKRISSGADMMGGLKGLGLNQFSNILPTAFDNSESIESFIDIPASSIESIFEFESEEEALIYQLKQKANYKINTLSSIKSEFATMESTIKDYQRRGEFRAIALTEINKLKFNPNIATNKIKKTSESILETILKINGQQNSSLAEVIKNNNEEKDLTVLINKQQSKEAEYANEVNSLKGIQTELTKLVPSGSGITDIYFSMEKYISESPSVLNKSQQISNNLNTLLAIEKDRSLTDLMSIWYEYEAISSNDFSTTYLSRAEGDQVVLGLTFQLKESVPDSIGVQQTIQLAPIKVPVYGRLKINASVGFSFGQFFDPPKSYFVRDSIILGQRGDDFIPMITSFVHFYSQSRSIVSIGGSLGLGIPLNGDGLGSTSFFVGPSLFFGQSERFVLNAGLMGGKVNRLAVGYQEGDHYDGDDNFIPTAGLYQLGYFVGLSFNIRG